jgi:hypothetical protein
MLKPGGLFVFTCASTGRPEHGTLRTRPQDSFHTRTGWTDWGNYYKNLTIEDVQAVIPLKEIFDTYVAYYHTHAKDLYFVGIKKGHGQSISIPEYQEHGVECTLKSDCC